MMRWIVFVGFIGACGGGGGAGADGPLGADGVADGPGTPDTRTVDAPADARRIDAPLPIDANLSCVTATDYPAVVAFAASDQAAGTAVGGGQTYYFWLGILANGTPEVAVLEIDLWPGYGVFTGMTEPAEGTYPITGSELSQVDCGVCVYLLGDLTIDALGRITAFDEVYFVDGGSVTISRIDTPAPGGGGPDAGVIDAGMVIDASPFDASAVDASTDADPIVDATPAARLAGSFTGLTFSQLDRMTFDPVPGGCRSAAAGGVFDAVLAP